MRRLIITAAIVVAGCAVTYEGPRTSQSTFSAPTDASRATTIIAARRVLVSEGFQILTADETSGTLSTAARDFRLNPNQADCGTTMGLDYLKDNRTTTTVAYGVIADDGRVTVRAIVQGEYKPGAVEQDITLTCVSRGALEQELLQKIKSALP